MTSRFLVGALGALLIAGPASAQGLPGNLYVGIVAGAQVFSDNEDGAVDIEFDTGYVVGGLVGYRFGDFRTEAELNYQETDAKADLAGSRNVDVEILRYTIGLYYDIRALQLPITPYIGGGIGLASIDASRGGNDETNFSWHGEVGGSIDLTPDLAVVPAYRYEWIDDEDLVSDDPVTSHAFRIGLRLSF